jgi:ribosomal-protein-alanine N-acetyltransferase
VTVVEEIVTERLVLRPFRLGDLDAVQAFASDPAVVVFVEWGPNTPAQTRTFLTEAVAAAAQDPRSRWVYAIEHAAAVIGSIELVVDDRQHGRGSLGYTVARPSWGRGFATEAAGALLHSGFDRLGLHKVSATCDPGNTGSARVLEKIGMRREGLLAEHMLIRGERRDRLLYAALDDHAAPSDVPRLLEIRHAAFRAHASAAHSPREAETLPADVDPEEIRACVADRRVFVARRDGRIAGLAAWDGDRLRHVYADPGAGRTGIGTRLLRRVEEDYRRRTGRAEIRAAVAPHAEGFYRANGYDLVERATARGGSGYLEMAKSL